MSHLSQRSLFVLFFLSGFSALVCQIVWLRLAFAAFGIVTPVMSVLLSTFMLGLGAGSWLAGAIVQRGSWSAPRALRAYAGAEILIGVGALTVPSLFWFGERLLLPVGEMGSVGYLTYSAIIMLGALVPFCLCMGLTYPFMMQAIRADQGTESSFSSLYLANVIGAMFGTLVAPFALVELWGFQVTLAVAAAANWCAAAGAIWLSTRQRAIAGRAVPFASVELSKAAADSAHPAGATAVTTALTLAVLFTTGLASMAAEVVWTRAFTPIVTTQVYWFAGLLFAYLLSTWVGSAFYRWQLARGEVLSTRFLLALLALMAFGQLLLADPRIKGPRAWMQLAWILAGIAPYCGILGYLTPKLIDEYSHGNPTSAGRAYAVNVLGCILGPLLASYLLLPYFGVQWSGILLALPLWCLAGLALKGGTTANTAADRGNLARRPGANQAGLLWGAAALCGVLAATVGKSREDQYAAENALILRDHTATVIADELNGEKRLLVNGTMITVLTPSTKMMAHLPLAHLDEPRSALVICFGMGTTYRSLLSWGIDTTAVELAPSVRDAFGYFFADAPQLRANPHGKIVIDDGRRFLRRTDAHFDLITLDPPPPVEAAGSSLLYSVEFYDLVKLRLSDRGLLQQWFPGGDRRIFDAALRSVVQSFPHVRVFHAFNGTGFHILASERPIVRRSAAELAMKLSPVAQCDLVEWTPDHTGESLLEAIINAEYEPNELLDPNPSVIITDDHPYNEYCLLRRLRERWAGTRQELQ